MVRQIKLIKCPNQSMIMKNAYKLPLKICKLKK
jgi:hypothetical protein